MRKQDIHVFLGGRLGNQLFIVSAVSRVVDFLVSCGKSPNVTWYYHDSSTEKALELLAFDRRQAKNSILTSSAIPLWIRDSTPYHRLLALFQHFLKKRSYVLPEKRSAVSFSEIKNSRRITVLGFYQDSQWAQEARLPISNCNPKQELEDSCNFIGIHFRFGDFQSESLQKEYGEVSVGYYEKALEHICSLLGDGQMPKVWVFTDDVTLAQSKIRCLPSAGKFEIHFAAHKELSLEKELALFASSKYLILSNSSFSWWAGYFSSRNALVIAPRPIYVKVENEGVIRDNWIRVPGYC